MNQLLYTLLFTLLCCLGTCLVPPPSTIPALDTIYHSIRLLDIHITRVSRTVSSRPIAPPQPPISSLLAADIVVGYDYTPPSPVCQYLIRLFSIFPVGKHVSYYLPYYRHSSIEVISALVLYPIPPLTGSQAGSSPVGRTILGCVLFFCDCAMLSSCTHTCQGCL
jgi:hypothetical protein